MIELILPHPLPPLLEERGVVRLNE